MSSTKSHLIDQSVTSADRDCKYLSQKIMKKPLVVFVFLFVFRNVLSAPQCGLPTEDFCPPGYHLVNRRCVLKCSDGFSLVNGRCELDRPTCPVGYNYNQSDQKCYALNPCPDGFRLSNNHCVSIDVACPAGYYLDHSDGVCHPSNPCPAGSVLQNGLCVGPTTTCLDGEYLVGGECKPWINTEPGCTEGYTMDPVSGKCVKHYKTDATCPKDSHIVNGTCVTRLTEPLKCPPHFVMDKGQCVFKKIVAATCPPDYKFESGKCKKVIEVQPTCPENSDSDSEECVRVTTELPSCGENYTLEDAHCVRTDTIAPSCPRNYHFESGHCVSTITSSPLCPPGYVLYDVCLKYVRIAVTCPPGYVLRSQKCWRDQSTEPKCPKDYTYENGTCVTIETSNVRCPYGSALVNKVCVTERKSQPKCPKNYYFKNGTCIIYRLYRPIYTNSHNYDNETPIQDIYNNKMTVHAPVNITSSNVNTVHITTAGRNCQNSVRTWQTNDTGGSNVIHIECVEDVTSSSAETEETTDNYQCCTIFGPRQCKLDGDEWHCFHRQHHRCGEFCTKDTIYLRPKRVLYKHNVLVMPPRSADSRTYINPRGKLDCSTCLHSHRRCPVTCGHYNCDLSSCEIMDHALFCELYGGQGCTDDDGCFEGSGCAGN